MYAPYVPSAYENVPDLSLPPPRELLHPLRRATSHDGESAQVRLERCAAFLRAACAENASLRLEVDAAERASLQHARSRAFRNQALELGESDRVNATLRQALRARGASGKDIRQAVTQEVWGGVQRVLGTSREALMLEVDRLNAALRLGTGKGKQRRGGRGSRGARREAGAGGDDSAREDNVALRAHDALPETPTRNSASLVALHGLPTRHDRQVPADADTEEQDQGQGSAAPPPAEVPQQQTREPDAHSLTAAALAEAEARHATAEAKRQEADLAAASALKDREALLAELAAEREAADAARADFGRQMETLREQLRKERAVAAASDATKLKKELKRVRAAATFMARRMQQGTDGATQTGRAASNFSKETSTHAGRKAHKAVGTAAGATVRSVRDAAVSAAAAGREATTQANSAPPASRSTSVSAETMTDAPPLSRNASTEAAMTDALAASNGAHSALQEALAALDARSLGDEEERRAAARMRQLRDEEEARRQRFEEELQQRRLQAVSSLEAKAKEAMDALGDRGAASDGGSELMHSSTAGLPAAEAAVMPASAAGHASRAESHTVAIATPLQPVVRSATGGEHHMELHYAQASPPSPRGCCACITPSKKAPPR